MKDLISVDVEEWHQTVLFDPGETDSAVRTDLPRDVERILSLLDSFQTKATFFVVGCVAEKYPGLVGSIASRGHEIASHGYSHRLVRSMRQDEFTREIVRSKELLTRQAGAEVSGYRASTWSLPAGEDWPLDALASAGYRYDSSLYPLKARPHMGREAEESRFPHRLDSGLWEFPPSTNDLLGWNVPFSGGTFLRFRTLGSIQRGIRRIHELGRPAMIYCHSWEFSGSVPGGIPAWKRFIQFGNVRSVETKIAALLGAFAFRPIRDLLSELQPSPEGAGR